MIDPGALQAFYHVGRLGGIGAAAREMKVTQPAVSQRIRKLERDLRLRLYGRTGRKIVLTEDGERIFAACRQAFEVLATVEASTHDQRAALRGSVKIAALSEFSKAFLLPLIRSFREEHPAVEFELKYRLPYEMLAPLMRHEVDLAVTNEPYRRPQVQIIPLFKEKVVCVGRPPAKRLSWEDLETLPWLSYGAEDPLWLEFEELAARHKAKIPRPLLQVADTDSILRLASQGAGFAFAPEHALTMRPGIKLSVYTLPFPPIVKSLYLCRLKTVAMGKASQAFWDSITSQFARTRHDS